MRQDIAIFGLYVPALFVCAILAGLVWFVLDSMALRLGLWRYVLHPPAVRLSLYVTLLALIAGLAPDF